MSGVAKSKTPQGLAGIITATVAVGGGLISIGGGGKKTTTTQTYAGTQCTSFMDPVTTTNTIKM